MPGPAREPGHADGGPGAGTARTRPNGKLTAFLLERKLLAACLVQKPVISMAKVNELAQRRTELAAFLTLQRAAASARLALRFRAAAQEDEEPADEG